MPRRKPSTTNVGLVRWTVPEATRYAYLIIREPETERANTEVIGIVEKFKSGWKCREFACGSSWSEPHPSRRTALQAWLTRKEQK